MTDIGLPTYASPPVVETILGVQFNPIESCSAAILGLFWSTIRDDWPTATEAPYLKSKFERFGTDHPWSDLRFQLKEGFPPLRLQMRDESTDWMVQLQNSRLHVNWIGYDATRDSTYPRYLTVRDKFESTWRHFSEFVVSEDLGEISSNQWEVTYTNHIPIGSVWRSPNDWGFMQLLGNTSILGDLAELEAFQGGWRFTLPDDAGRLYVSWKTARRRHPEDVEIEQDIVVLEQTARGPLPDESDLNSVLTSLDTGREVIVKSFAQLMNEDANQFWGYKS